MPLAGLSPFGPIFAKELRVASRRRRNYLLRVLYLGGLLLILLLAWAITRGRYGYGGIAARQQQQEQLGWFFFMFFSMFSVCAMGLIGPVLTSTAINGERDAKTLHVLLMTPLTAWQIVSGKLFSRLLTALTLIGLSLPVLALVRLLGGVELDQMFGVIALSIAAAMVSAALGLLLSIVVSRAYAVIILSYLVIGFVYLFVPMMFMMLIAPHSGARTVLPWLHVITTYNPFWSVGFLASGQGRMIGVNWVTCTAVHVAATAVLLIVAALLVRRLAKKEGSGGGPGITAPVAIENLFAVPSAASALSQSDLLPPPRRSKPAGVSDRPVLWHELRRPLMTKRWQRVVGAIVILLMLAVSYIACAANNQLDRESTQIPYAWVFHTLLMLLAGVLSATAIAQEKEGDQWTVLLASPLSGAAIVWGKALGVARRMVWPVALIAAHFFAFRAAGVITQPTFLMAVLVIVTFNTLWIATGVALSLTCRKVTVAVIVNLALPVILYGVISLLLAVLDQFMGNGRGELTELPTWWLPYFYLGNGLAHGGWREHPWLPGAGYDTVTQWEFFAIALTVGLMHVAAAVALLSVTAARFNTIVGRSSQLDPLPRARFGGHGFPVASRRPASA